MGHCSNWASPIALISAFRDVMDRLNDCVKASVDEKPGSWKMRSPSEKDRSLIEALGL